MSNLKKVKLHGGPYHGWGGGDTADRYGNDTGFMDAGEQVVMLGPSDGSERFAYKRGVPSDGYENFYYDESLSELSHALPNLGALEKKPTLQEEADETGVDTMEQFYDQSTGTWNLSINGVLVDQRKQSYESLDRATAEAWVQEFSGDGTLRLKKAPS